MTINEIKAEMKRIAYAIELQHSLKKPTAKLSAQFYKLQMRYKREWLKSFKSQIPITPPGK